MKCKLFSWSSVKLRMLILCVSISGLFTGFVLRAKHQCYVDAALLSAIRSDEIERTVTLLKEGANPNARESDKNQLRLGAAISTMFHSKVNRDSWQSDTALILAIKTTDSKLVSTLIRVGADINGRDKQGRTGLMLAFYQNGMEAKQENEQTIAILLNAGADVNAIDWQGRDVLTWSVNYQGLEYFHELQKHGLEGNHANPNWGAAALIAASSIDNLEVIQCLLNMGARVDATDETGITALMNTDSTEIAKVLISHGANVNAVDKKGRTPLYMATMVSGNSKIVDLLKKSGAKK